MNFPSEPKVVNRSMADLITSGVVSALLAIALFTIRSTPAYASPLFSLADPTGFQQALSSGRIGPVTAWDSTFEALYPGQQGLFRLLQLSVDSEGLVAAFGSEAPLGAIGAYSYFYPGDDPDLTGATVKADISFRFNAPGSLSVRLRDTNGKEKAWRFDGFSGQGRAMIAVAADGGMQGANALHTDAGFDVKHVTVISTDEKGGDTTTHSLAVVPEPCSLALLGIGVTGFVVGGRRRRTDRKPVATTA